MITINSNTPILSATHEMACGGYPAGTPVTVISDGNEASRTSRHFHWFIWTGRQLRKPTDLEHYLFAGQALA
jgi:hypothetical protein